MLSASVEDLRERLVLAWLKISAILVRLMIKESRADARTHAETCRREAAHLGLKSKEDEFARLIQLAAEML